jgi:UDP-glucose 4-epimerase
VIVAEGTSHQSSTAPAADSWLAGKRCAVLGAGGFLGRALSTALCDGGAVVAGFGRPAKELHADERVTFVHATFSDSGSLAEVVAGCELVFHLIGSWLPESSNVDPANALLEEVYETIKLLDLCRAAGVRKIVFASSGGTVYGVPMTIPTPESAPLMPISAYGINKLTIERYLSLYRRLYGIDYCTLRIANPYGRGQSPFKKQGVIASLLYAGLTHAPLDMWGTGEVTRDFVHIDDVVSALLGGAAYDGPHKTFNVGSGIGRTMNEVVDGVCELLAPSSVRIVRKPGRKADVPISILDATLAEREFGWKPAVGFRDGLADTASWMRVAYGIA